MLKATLIAAAAAATLMTTGVSAQVIDLGGRGGPAIDLRNNRQRERDYDRENGRRDRDVTTGSVRNGCRSVTVRDTDAYGNTTTRTRNEC